METGDGAAQTDTDWPTANPPGPDEELGAVWSLGEQPSHAARASAGAEMAGARPAGFAGGALWSLGLLMGAAAMYLLDAEHGEERRAGVTRRVQHYRDEVDRTIDRAGARTREQLRGTARAAWRDVRERLIPDGTIRRAIYARLEEVLPFEEAARIEVTVRRGRVTLEGRIAAEHLNRLLGRVATVPGVRGLDNRLIVQAPPASRSGEGGAALSP